MTTTQATPPPAGDIREVGPVALVTIPTGQTAYLVTRYNEAVFVLSDPIFSRQEVFRTRGTNYTGPGASSTGDMLLDMDPPQHTRIRGLVAKAFSRRRTEMMRPGIQQIVDELLTGLADHGPPADLVDALCLPLPITVVCQLLGVSYDDRAWFQERSLVLASTADTAESKLNAVNELRAYLTEIIAEKRKDPKEDLLSELVSARAEERLTEEELINLGVLLLPAGYETTANQICKSMHALLLHPDEYSRLCAEPAGVPAASEELMRLYPSVLTPGFRVATEDVTVGEVTIPAGSLVIVSDALANRDPEIFARAEEMDLRRTKNPHLAFGHGLHFCLGAALARVELEAAMTGLVTRFPGLRLAVDPETIRWHTERRFRGPSELPVTW
ncbi:cytochrome P450 [Kibdelosporangium persicum]|uniref:Nocardicin N-oxygenase n=1 Tax=Kibdelosporangium persicum TaxID=2698649 RepID=A0ABX2F8D6_9PSEU|nr:cytochrome P450 [Kibdelosporangium persicum]NRN67235.1 Nocardicin N-oxygenase [Kibdelosporangium persicum]